VLIIFVLINFYCLINRALITEVI